MTVEKIVRSTFANPNRRIFPESTFHDTKPALCPEDIECEELLKRISFEIPLALHGFNYEKIYLQDRERLLGIDEE